MAEFFYRMSVCRTSGPRKPFADDNWPNQLAEFRYSNPDGRNHLPNSSSIFNKSFPHSFLPARAGASVLGEAKYYQDSYHLHIQDPNIALNSISLPRFCYQLSLYAKNSINHGYTRRRKRVVNLLWSFEFLYQEGSRLGKSSG